MIVAKAFAFMAICWFTVSMLEWVVARIESIAAGIKSNDGS